MIECNNFRMLNMSLSTLIGLSPKIEYFCGKCNGYNKTRIFVNSIKVGRPYTMCKCCGETNIIPIHIVNRNGDEED